MAEVALERASEQARNLFNRGFTAFERKNFDYAIDLLGSCLEVEPGLLQARKFLRAAEIRKYKASKHNSLSRSLSTVKGMSTLVRVAAQIKSGKKDQALVDAEKLLRIDPLNKKFIRAFVQAAIAADLPEAAILTLETARDHYPEDIPVLNWLGSLYQKLGRTKSARECFEKLCEICPNDPDALKALKDAMAIDSISADGWAQAAETGGSYRDIIKDTDEAELLEKEGKEVKSEQDTDTLIADTLRKIEQEPENINYRRQLARYYAEQNDFANAVSTVQAAIDMSPGDPELDNALTSIRLEQFDHEVTMLRKAGDEEAAASKEHERLEFRFNDLQEKVKRYPNDLRLKQQWGVMLYDNEYWNEAIQQFQAAQRSPKDRTSALYYLAMCFKQKQQYDLAVEQLERALKEMYTMDEPKKGVLYELGQIAELMGDSARASGYFKQIYQVDIGYKDVSEKVEKGYGQ